MAVHLQRVEGAQLQHHALVDKLLQDGLELLQERSLFVLQRLVGSQAGVDALGQSGLEGHKLDNAEKARREEVKVKREYTSRSVVL